MTSAVTQINLKQSNECIFLIFTVVVMAEFFLHFLHVSFLTVKFNINLGVFIQCIWNKRHHLLSVHTPDQKIYLDKILLKCKESF